MDTSGKRTNGKTSNLKVECNPDIHILSMNREGQENLTVKIWAKLDNPF